MNRRSTLAILLLGWLAGVARAQTGASGRAYEGVGTVKSVDATRSSVKLDHEPIPSLGWPRMTMDFRVRDAKLLQSLRNGDRVRFLFEPSGSDYVVSRITKAEK